MKAIYKIKNIINNKIYIGSSINFKRRKSEHLSKLRRNIHPSLHLQASFNKYGEENFIFEIIEVIKNEDILEREQFYINYHQSYDKKIGYNLATNVYRTIDTSKSIYKLNLEGLIIDEYKSIVEASEKNKISASAISLCANRISNKSKNFIWIFKSEYDYINIDELVLKANKKKHYPETIQKMKDSIANRIISNSRIVIRYDDNIYEEYKSINEAARLTNTNPEVISGCCKGKYKKGKGFKWKYKENNEK